MTSAQSFQPEWNSPPGDTIADLLSERGLTVEEFASQIEETTESTKKIISGEQPISIGLAQKLRDALGASTSFWMMRDVNYRRQLFLVEHQSPGSDLDTWLSELPIRDMIRFGWIRGSKSRHQLTAACLEFFGTQDVRSWRDTYESALLEQFAFRTSATYKSRPGATVAWLRKGEMESYRIACRPWNAKLFRAALSNARTLTRQKDPGHFLPALQTLCAAAGVALVVLRTPDGCRASGATRFLGATKALLLLSFRHLSDDHFWFSFFHEAGHLMLHGKDAKFLEGNEGMDPVAEAEANRFAAELLVPTSYQLELSSVPLDTKSILRLAKVIGVSPGIVVGQLQHQGRIRPNQLNSLKRRFRWN